MAGDQLDWDVHKAASADAFDRSSLIAFSAIGLSIRAVTLRGGDIVAIVCKSVPIACRPVLRRLGIVRIPTVPITSTVSSMKASLRDFLLPEFTLVQNLFGKFILLA